MSGGESYWIGLSDARTEGTFEWLDGSPVTFTKWNVGEPNDWGSNEDCAEINAAGGMNDNNCS